jgi:hypothetical protein
MNELIAILFLYTIINLTLDVFAIAISTAKFICKVFKSFSVKRQKKLEEARKQGLANLVAFQKNYSAPFKDTFQIPFSDKEKNKYITEDRLQSAISDQRRFNTILLRNFNSLLSKHHNCKHCKPKAASSRKVRK